MGEQLFMAFCNVCHKVEVTREMHDNPSQMLAPPAFAVADHYKWRIEDPEERVRRIIEYVVAPSEKAALMPGAIQRFGVMPAMPLQKEQLDAIARYVLDTDFEEPSWYGEHFEQEHGKRGQGRGMGKGMGRGRESGSVGKP